MKRIIALGMMGLGVLSVAQAQEADKFKVYGFADMSMEYYKNASSFNTQFLGQDKLNLALTHANTYFDFNPNQNIKALLEVGFTSNKSKDVYSVGSDPNLIVDPSGNALSDAQIIGYVTSLKLDSIVAATNTAMGLPAGSITLAQLEGMAPGTTAAVQSGVTEALTPQLAQARASQEAAKEKRYQNISIQRAYFDLLINDGINFRMGQFITPAGIWNVDHASPVILTVRQPLQTTVTPIFPESQLGFMLYGRQYLGDHDLNYNLYATSGRTGPSAASIGSGYDNSIDSPSDLAVGGHIGLKLDILKGISFGISSMTGTMRKKFQDQQATLALADLLQGAIAAKDLQYNSHFDTKEREFIVGGDTKIEAGNLTVQGECNFRTIDNQLVKGKTDMLGYYGLVAYKIAMGNNFGVSPYAMYENVGWKTTDAGARSLGDSDINGFYLALSGLNFSIFTNFHLKLEVSRLQLLLNKNPTNFPTDITENDLASNVFSSQFSVAF